MSLFDGFKKNRPKNDIPKAVPNTTQKQTQQTQSQTNFEDSEGFYFEDMMEFALYAKLFARKSNKNVQWLAGSAYVDEFKRGYNLYDQGRFDDAVAAFKHCLELNPVGINARFELAESYVRLGNLAAAQRSLLDATPFLVDEKNIARFYRRLGYIAIERKDFRTAVACYQYSLKFENHPSVPQELAYIKSMGGKVSTAEDPARILKNAGLPLLEKQN